MAKLIYIYQYWKEGFVMCHRYIERNVVGPELQKMCARLVDVVLIRVSKALSGVLKRQKVSTKT